MQKIKNYFKKIVSLTLVLFMFSMPLFDICNLNANTASAENISTENTDNIETQDYTRTAVNKLQLASKVKTLYILFVGNSFSYDTVQWLYDVASSAGYHVYVGHVGKGSSTLEDHYTNAQSDNADYEYRYNYNGTWNTEKDKTIAYGLEQQPWDIVFYQQQSIASGKSSRTKKLYIQYLSDYAVQHCSNKNVKIGYEMSWAVANSCDESDYTKNFPDGQLQLFNSICDVTSGNTVAKSGALDLICVTGTAVQNVRCYIGDNINRDEKHLSYDLGRTLAAMTICSSVGMDLSNLTTLPTAVKNYQSTKKIDTTADYNLTMFKQCISEAESTPYALGAISSKVSAYTLPIATLNVKASDTTRTISWNSVQAVKYNLYRKLSNESSYSNIYTANSGSSSYTYTDKTAGSQNASYVLTAVGDKFVASSTSTEVVSLYVPATAITSVFNNSQGIKVKFNLVSNAESYNIYRKKSSDSTWTKIGTTTDNYYLDTSVYNGSAYDYRVYAVSGTSKSKASETSTTCRLSSPTKLRKSSIKNTSIKVKWNKNSKASGYQIQYSTNSSFNNAKTVTCKKSAKTATIKSLKSKKKYYIRIRCFKTYKNVNYYSAWSDTLALKTK